MKPERALIAERVAAQHCQELLRVGPSPEELLPQLAMAGERLARALGPALAQFLGGRTPTARVTPPRALDDWEFELSIAHLAANSLLAVGGKNTPLLASLEAGAVLGIVDRAFGGSGQAPQSLPTEFPFSAELMVSRLETLIISLLTEALGLGGEGAIRLLRRNGSLEKLAPFSQGSRLAVLQIEVAEEGGASFALTLALPLDRLAELFGHGERSPATRPTPIQPANPANEPFGDVPLSLRAVLVDMLVPMSTIANLEPGQVLPITVARNVPLRIDETTIAHGTIGALDDRVAVQISKAF